MERPSLLLNSSACPTSKSRTSDTSHGQLWEIRLKGKAGIARALRHGEGAVERWRVSSATVVARIEGGKVRPSTSALERFAQATPTRLRIVFELQASS